MSHQNSTHDQSGEQTHLPLVQDFDTNHKKLYPSMSITEIWDWAGNNGTYSASPQHFITVFDVLRHHKGILFYRLKTTAEFEFLPPVDLTDVKVRSTIFEKIRFHDPTENFLSRCHRNEVNVMFTHDDEQNLIDYMETSYGISMQNYKEITATKSTLDAWCEKQQGVSVQS